MPKTLKQLRSERRLTVRRHAAAAGVSTTTLMDIEHSRVRPHYATFAATLDSKISEAA